MYEENDRCVAAFQEKFAAKYAGPGVSAQMIPWDVILAALMSLLDGCFPATVKAQVNRPLVKARMRRRFLENGVPLRDVHRTIAATVAAVEASTDEEIAGYVAAAEETQYYGG